MKLVFAQGNPDPKYNQTRHNVGFLAVDTFATDTSAKWEEKSKLKATIAEVTIVGQKVLLVKPSTFYNETGGSARAIIDFYKLDPVTDVLVIHDDFALPFGTIRTREQGSDAGNNGIKSLNAHIGARYARIRIGIWSELRDRMDDADFVLSKFSREESAKLTSDIIPHVTKLIQDFCLGTLEKTSYKL